VCLLGTCGGGDMASCAFDVFRASHAKGLDIFRAADCGSGLGRDVGADVFGTGGREVEGEDRLRERSVRTELVVVDLPLPSASTAASFCSLSATSSKSETERAVRSGDFEGTAAVFVGLIISS
jgi:hypothetical protein